MDNLIHINLEGKITKLLVKVEPRYAQYINDEGKKKVIYTELTKALYGTVQASYLLWKNQTSLLVNEFGFTINHYGWCVSNKEIKGAQCTIGWHVDDLKISHRIKEVAENIVSELQDRYGKEALLTVSYSTVHEYL